PAAPRPAPGFRRQRARSWRRIRRRSSGVLDRGVGCVGRAVGAGPWRLADPVAEAREQLVVPLAPAVLAGVVVEHAELVGCGFRVRTEDAFGRFPVRPLQAGRVAVGLAELAVAGVAGERPADALALGVLVEFVH